MTWIDNFVLVGLPGFDSWTTISRNLSWPNDLSGDPSRLSSMSHVTKHEEKDKEDEKEEGYERKGQRNDR